MAESWRARDLRGDAGPEGSVAAVVRYARRGLYGARAGEAALFGATALCLTLAAGAWTGAGLGRADAWAVAAASAACAGLSWWLEHRRTPAAVARALDRRLRHQGALVTAYELEGRGDAGPLAPLVVAHVLARLRRREALRVLRPGLALPVAAPLLGAAVLAAVLQATSVAPPQRSIAAVTGGLVGRLNGTLSGALADEVVDLELVHALRGAAAAARGLDEALRAADAGGPRPADAAERVEALDRTLAGLAAEAADRPELRAELSAARSWLDALRQGLDPDRDERGGAGPGAAEPGSGDGDGPDGGTAGPGVTGAGGDGTMSGSTSPAGGGEAPPVDPPDPGTPAVGAAPAGGGAVETGAAAGAWWPAEHDAIVRRWLERVRADGR